MILRDPLYVVTLLREFSEQEKLDMTHFQATLGGIILLHFKINLFQLFASRVYEGLFSGGYAIAWTDASRVFFLQPRHPLHGRELYNYWV